jgi:hypothetical protein
MKFKVGDIICAKIPRTGFEKGTVERVQDGKYYCKIMNGTAILPIETTDKIYKKL